MLAIFAVAGLFIQFSAFATSHTCPPVCISEEGKEILGEFQEYRQQEAIQSIFGDQDPYIGIGVVIVIIIIAIAIGVSKKGKTEQIEERRGWTENQKDEVLKRQKGRCASCGNYAKSYQFDHIDGDHSNNSMENCQALCPNCHDRKTRGLN